MSKKYKNSVQIDEDRVVKKRNNDLLELYEYLDTVRYDNYPEIIYINDREVTTKYIKEENRIIEVQWYNQEKVSYTVEIEVFANDRNGLLADIVQKINDSKAKILGVNARATKERIAITEVTLEVDSLESLNKIIRELRRIDSVYDVNRKK